MDNLKRYAMVVLYALALVSIAVLTLVVLMLLLGADVYMQQVVIHR